MIPRRKRWKFGTRTRCSCGRPATHRVKWRMDRWRPDVVHRGKRYVCARHAATAAPGRGSYTWCSEVRVYRFRRLS